jgi:hypothetical protein
MAQRAQMRAITETASVLRRFLKTEEPAQWRCTNPVGPWDKSLGTIGQWSARKRDANGPGKARRHDGAGEPRLEHEPPSLRTLSDQRL